MLVGFLSVALLVTPAAADWTLVGWSNLGTHCMDADYGVFSLLPPYIPITPYDDARRRNPYPLMRLVARDLSGQVLAITDIVLPVSDEMSCAACHASGTSAAAQPLDG